jgi:hypothetical protein
MLRYHLKKKRVNWILIFDGNYGLRPYNISKSRVRKVKNPFKTSECNTFVGTTNLHS